MDLDIAVLVEAAAIVERAAAAGLQEYLQRLAVLLAGLLDVLHAEDDRLDRREHLSNAARRSDHSGGGGGQVLDEQSRQSQERPLADVQAHRRLRNQVTRRPVVVLRVVPLDALLGFGAGRQRHMRAGFRQRRRCGEPDAAPAAGDERALAVEAERGGLGEVDRHHSAACA